MSHSSIYFFYLFWDGGFFGSHEKRLRWSDEAGVGNMWLAPKKKRKGTLAAIDGRIVFSSSNQTVIAFIYQSQHLFDTQENPHKTSVVKERVTSATM